MITRTCSYLFLCLLPLSIYGFTGPISLQTADQFFMEGDFGSAKQSYQAVLRNDRNSIHATLRLGQIALLSNRLPEAERFLKRTLVLEPGNKDANRFLAEAYVRGHKFAQAAQIDRELDLPGKAAQMESLARTVPYQIAKDFHEVHIPFVLTDPLPVIQVQLDGTGPLNFFIDTGGSDIILDPAIAQKAGVITFGSTTGTFAGGKQAELVRGQLGALALESLTIRNIPVLIQSTRRYSAIFQGKPIDGIIGTVFLSQFLSTIDYANAELVLRRRSAKLMSKDSAFVLPIWLAQDHLIFTKGTVNNSPPVLMLVDTGLAGMGITAPKALLDAAGVHIAEAKMEGLGGGGAVQAQPFTADRVSLGPVTRTNISGVFGVFPASLENVDGLHIAALISHQFFRQSALTLDFERMQLRLAERH